MKKEIYDNSNELKILNNLLDQICKSHTNTNNNNLSSSNFKSQIDELNLKFYLETEKYLTSSKSQGHQCQSTLFVILFKQISLYIKELERLNQVIIEQQDMKNKYKEEFFLKEKLISSLKLANKKLELKLSQVLDKENALVVENTQLKKENEFIKTNYNSLCQRYIKDNNNSNHNQTKHVSEITKANSSLSNEFELFIPNNKCESNININGITLPNQSPSNNSQATINSGLIKLIKNKITKRPVNDYMKNALALSSEIHAKSINLSKGSHRKMISPKPRNANASKINGNGTGGGENKNEHYRQLIKEEGNSGGMEDYYGGFIHNKSNVVTSKVRKRTSHIIRKIKHMQNSNNSNCNSGGNESIGKQGSGINDNKSFIVNEKK
jgi:hypothetical protein